MNKQIVGFDFGEKSLKMAVLSGGELKNAVSVELPDDLMSDGKILSMDAMADFITVSAKDNGIPKGDAAMVIPSKEVIVRNIKIPAITDQQMKFNLPFEFKDYLSQNKTDYIFDYTVLSLDESVDATPQLHIIACAVLRSDIEQYRAMFKRAGFKLKTAVPEEIALANVLARYHKITPKAPLNVCLLDLGHKGTRVHMYNGSEPMAKTSMELGGAALDMLIAEEQGLDARAANALKLTNFNRVVNTSRVWNSYHDMSMDVMKNIHFYNYNHREDNIEEMVIFGGGADLDPLRKELKSVTGLPVQDASVMLGKTAGVTHEELFVLAYGSAINEG